MGSNVVPVIAAAVSAISAGIAAYQAHTALTVPFRSALYASRAGAIRDFVSASGTFDASLRRARIDLPYDVYGAGSIDRQTDEQMVENAKAAYPVILAHGAYLAAVNATLPTWTNETRTKIGASIQSAKAAADCYIQIGSHPRAMNAEYWQTVKGNAAESCQEAGNYLSTYTDDIAAAVAAMNTELLKTEQENVPPGNGSKAGGL